MIKLLCCIQKSRQKPTNLFSILPLNNNMVPRGDINTIWPNSTDQQPLNTCTEEVVIGQERNDCTNKIKSKCKYLTCDQNRPEASLVYRTY